MEAAALYLTLAVTALAAIVVVAITGLKGFTAWIELRRSELTQSGQGGGVPSATSRIEIADLKERIRKLEAIAAGVDL
jgi:hypothetical protein